MKTLLLAFALLVQLTIYSQQKANNAYKNNKPPFSIGIIDGLDSRILNERRILNIYLPDGYDSRDTVKYPVIYLLDGSADEDFIHIAGLVQFNSFEWVGRVPKSIVVGIATVDRRRDYTFPTTVEQEKERFPAAGHSQKFISFLEKELQPYIETNYNAGKIKTLIGQSMGGLLATEILTVKPMLFNRYIIVSPSLWWDNGSLLDRIAGMPEQHAASAKVFIAVGKEGLAPGETPRVMEVDANLLADSLRKKNPSLQVYFDYLPDEGHATIMHQAVLNAFKVIYRK